MATSDSKRNGRKKGATSDIRELTDITVRNLPRPQSGTKLYIDLSYRQTPAGSQRRRGLALAVADSGVKTWYARLPTKKALGRFPEMPLGNARAFFDEVRDVKDDGGDWRRYIKENGHRFRRGGDSSAPPTKPASTVPTNDKLVRVYVAELSQTNRKWRQQERQLKMYFLDAQVDGRRLGNLTPHEITVSDIKTIVSRLSERRAYRAAQILRGEVRSYFNWLLGKKRSRDEVTGDEGASATTREPKVEGLPANPCDYVRPKTRKERRYELQPEDISDFLAALAKSKVRTQIKRILRTQLETFTRVGEITALRWDEVNLKKGEITVPGERTKNGEPLVIFITLQLKERLKTIRSEQKQAGYTGDYVFPRPRTNDGADRAIDSSDVGKALNRERCIIRRRGCTKPERQENGTLDIHHDFTTHSLRRTARTWAASEGIPDPVVMALMSHKRNMSDMSQRYNAYDYKAERTEVLQRFADHLEALDGNT